MRLSAVNVKLLIMSMGEFLRVNEQSLKKTSV